MANVTGFVLMYGASVNAVDVLITFGRVFSKINARSKHAPNVGMPFIKAFLHNCINKRRSMKQHTFVALVMIFFSHFSSTMGISFLKLDVSDLLDLDDTVTSEDSSSMTLITMLSYGRLQFFFHSCKFGIFTIDVY